MALMLKPIWLPASSATVRPVPSSLTEQLHQPPVRRYNAIRMPAPIRPTGRAAMIQLSIICQATVPPDQRILPVPFAIMLKQTLPAFIRMHRAAFQPALPTPMVLQQAAMPAARVHPTPYLSPMRRFMARRPGPTLQPASNATVLPVPSSLTAALLPRTARRLNAILQPMHIPPTGREPTISPSITCRATAMP